MSSQPLTDIKVWKKQTKMALANERTLIAGVRGGATFGVGAIVASAARGAHPGKGIAAVSATTQAVLGLLLVLFGGWQFVRRGWLLRRT